MAANHRHSTTAHNESAFATWIAGIVLALVSALVIGGFWIQSQRTQDQQLRQKATAYQTYLDRTKPTLLAPEQPQPARAEVHETRQYLLNHPAVTPGTAFDKPGVQATGKAIVQAIDRAKGL